MKTLVCTAFIMFLSISAFAKEDIAPLEQLLLDKKYEEFHREAEKAAEKHDAQALFLLGKAYHLGLGVKVATQTAMRYYKESAALGNARAWHNMGAIELDDQRSIEAARYFEKALALGLKDPTITNLGLAYLDMGDTFQNVGALDKAMEYLRQTYESKPDDRILRSLIRASTLASTFTPASRSENEAPKRRLEALKWIELGKSKGFGMAYQNHGALLYYDHNVKDAIPLFEKASELGVPKAGFILGQIALNGEDGTPRNKEAALGWFEKAAKLGDKDAGTEAVKILSEKISWDMSRVSAPELQIIVDRLAEYEKLDVYGLNDILRKARHRLCKLNIFNARNHQPTALPPGKIIFSLQLTDMPPPGGIPLINEPWRIVELKDLYVDPIGLKGIVSKVTDKNGYMRTNENDSVLLRNSLESGHTLAWVGLAGKSLLLEVVPSKTKGILELKFDDEIEMCR